MDHIPRLRSHPIEVQLLSDKDYEHDGMDFSRYPDKKLGLKTVREWNVLFESKPVRFLAFLETWTYFGYLSNVLRRRVKTADFVDKSTQSIFILNTKKLPRYLEGWWKNYRLPAERSDLVKNVTYGVDLHKALRGRNNGNLRRDGELEARESLFQYLHNTRIPKDIRTPQFAVATSILVETIGASIAQIAPLSLMPVIRGSERWESEIWRLLADDGWCPRDLTSLFTRLNTSSLYFLHGIQRPRLDLEHHVQAAGTPNADQDACSAFRCSKLSIDPGNYRTAHTATCQGCTEATVDSKRLYSILKDKEIPLIQCVPDELEGAEIRLDKKEASSKYVAISHVWSDGLGNLRANSIPRCQLGRLSKLVRNLPGEYKGMTHFWFDTICVPPDSLGQKECQDNAISQMRDLYESASTVLVLDSWLMSDASLQMSEHEIGLRILSSTWNTRLWTFQEVALAKDPHFQLCDGAYSLDEGMARITNQDDFPSSITLQPVLQDYHFTTRKFWQPDRVQNLIAISGVLTDRTTSEITDEAICIAVLLGLDSGAVAEEPKTPPESRMKKLWRMVPTVPNPILSCDLETFDEDGLRWAPKSFLRSAWASSTSPNGVPDTSRIGIFNQAPGISVLSIGLHLRSGGLLIPARDVSLSGTIYVLVENKWKIVDISGRINNDATGFNPDGNGTPRSYFINPYLKYEAKYIAFVRDEIIGQNTLGEDPTKTGREGGCLVAITEKRYGILFARRICSAEMVKVADHDFTMIEYLEQHRRDAKLEYGCGYVTRDIHGCPVLGCIAGQQITPSQQWIIM